MLSIGKVGGGQASPSYYVESVAQGAEDYYAGTGEAKGVWHGKGADDRKLSGTVDEGEFLKLLEGDQAPGKTVLGYDLTFSAPKSVSLLYGLGDAQLSRQVRDAHDEAVRQSLDYLEDHACWTRRGRAGRRHVEGEGLTVATFRHRTSRAGDPQLHTHSVVANATKAEGKVTALDGQALYAHARTAGYLYQAALRGQLTQHIGVEWRPVENGMAEIAGFDEAVLKHFSQRSQDIERHLDERGVHSMKAARIAKLETRRAKQYDVPLGELREQWKARAAEHGLGQDELASVLDRRMAGKPVQPDIGLAGEQMTSPSGITERASTFDRRDVLRDWAESHREGARVDRIEQLADRWLASDYAVQLEPEGRRKAVGGPRHSTPDMLRLERHLVQTSLARRNTGVAVGDAGAVESAPFLAAEQRQLLRDVVLSGDGVQVVRAAAGTGKTRALGEACAAWEKADVRVFGCALAARAAVELESVSGIDSSTVARLERDLDEGYGLPRGSVLIVDEAGMVGTRQIARLATHCAETNSKLVLVGDDHQLPEIDAGGAFRRLAKELGASELHHVRRQEEAWDVAALTDLRHGKVADWADAYRDRGRLVAEPTALRTRGRLVSDWWDAARSECDAVMIAHRRADVAELNAQARALMRQDGRLGEEEVLTADGRAFSIGDRVLTKQNDRRLDVVNGTRAQVVDVDLERRTLGLELADGSTRSVDAAFLDRGSLMHGYALTAHAAQGATVDRSFVLGSDDLYKEWGYTAMTRHTQEARYYVVSPGSVERALPGLEPDPDPLTEDVVASMSRSGRKTAAHDVLDKGFGKVEIPERPRPGTSHQSTESDAAIAAREAQERAVGLERQLAEVKPWQRKLGKDLRAALERQQKDAARWAARAAEEPSMPAQSFDSALPQARVMSAPELRVGVQSPSDGIVRRIGERPPGLAGRDAWTRAAMNLVTDPTGHLDLPASSSTMADTGLDL